MLRRGLGMLFSNSSQVCLSGKHKLWCVQRLALAKDNDCLGLLNSGCGGEDWWSGACLTGVLADTSALGVDMALSLALSPTRLCSSEVLALTALLLLLLFESAACG